MKKIIIFILFAGINISVFAQTDYYKAMLKYWYYRDRLKYFVVPGYKQGESEVLSIRNDFDLTDLPNYRESIDGQHGDHTLFYFGTLATEYSLLINNGYYIQAAGTLNELTLALQQYGN